MMLLPGEEELVRSNGGKIVLTNLRIYMNTPEGSGTYSISMFLEKISSVESRYKSNPLLGIIGLIVIGMGLFAATGTGDNNVASIIFIIAGLLCIAMYYASRKHVVTIMSDGGRALEFEAGSVGAGEIDKFLKDVQEAKLARVKTLINA